MGRSNNISAEMGQKIRSFRLEQELSQAELAERLGISKQAISKVESGKERMTLERLFGIMDALDYEVEIKPKQRGGDLVAEWNPIGSEDPELRKIIRQARVLAEKMASYLYEEYDVDAVYVFGSLGEKDASMFAKSSDLDLLVEGLSADKFINAISSLELEVMEPFLSGSADDLSFGFDLVRASELERAAEIINSSGRSLLIPQPDSKNG